MAKCEKLLEKAKGSSTLKFAELCSLAECHGFVHIRTTGSHRIYSCPGFPNVMNFQPDRNGEAKRFQIRQLLNAIDELG